MNHFTPWSALAGGLLIGLAVLGLRASTGRLAGISGIAHGAWQAIANKDASEARWRLSFLIGLALGGAGAAWLWGRVPDVRPHLHWVWLLGGGLLVGWGTSMGQGCTSGHGVCGLARLSPRALAATLSFMATGALSVLLLRHVLGMQ